MKKGKPFLEICASALHEDFRFPVLELFAFLFALGTFVFATNLFESFISSDESWLFMLIATRMGLPLFVFLILVFKNIAYGLGGDLEKGIIQTLLSYPLKRRNILTAKLLSAIGIPLLLFSGFQLIALVILAPSMILPNIGVILLTYVANCGYVLLLTAIILLVTLFVRKGGIGLIVGIVVYFALGVATQLVLFFAFVTSSALPLQIITLLSPSSALSAHYGLIPPNIGWTPSLAEVAFYVVGNYVIIASLFLVAYLYFSRRLSI